MEESSFDSDLRLPAELWIQEIGCDLPGLDLISLSQTCKALHSLLSTREVWVVVLRRTCIQHGVFLPSFPTDEMDLEELKRAATSPGRWGRLVKRHGVTGDKLEATPPLAPTHRSHSWRVGTYGQRLVRGGRYMVTTYTGSVAPTVCVALWDLGIPGAALKCEPEMVDSRVYPSGQSSRVMAINLVQVWFDEGSDALRVLAVYGGISSDDLLTAVVLTISPGGDKRFKELGVIKVRRSLQWKLIDCFIRGQTILLVIGGDVMILWQYHRGFIAIWRFTDTPSRIRFQIAVLTDDFIACVYPRETLTLAFANTRLRYTKAPLEGEHISLADVPTVYPDQSQPPFLNTEVGNGTTITCRPSMEFGGGPNLFLTDVRFARNIGFNLQTTRVDRYRLSVGAQGLQTERVRSTVGFPNVVFDYHWCGAFSIHNKIIGRPSENKTQHTYVYPTMDETFPTTPSSPQPETDEEGTTQVRLVPMEVKQPDAMDSFSSRVICRDQEETRRIQDGERTTDSIMYFVDFLK